MKGGGGIWDSFTDNLSFCPEQVTGTETHFFRWLMIKSGNFYFHSKVICDNSHFL